MASGDWDDFEVEIRRGEYAELRVPITITDEDGVTSAFDLTGSTNHLLLMRKSPYDDTYVAQVAGTVLSPATDGVLSFAVPDTATADLENWKHKLYAQVIFDDGAGNPIKPFLGRIVVPQTL